MITHLHPNPNPWPLRHPANLSPHPTRPSSAYPASLPPLPTGTSSRSKPAYTHTQPQPRPRPRLRPQVPHAPWIHMVYGLLLDSHQLDARARAFAAQEGHAPILALAPVASRSRRSSSNTTRSISIGALRESYMQRILTNLDAHAHAHTTKEREGQKTGEERTSVEKVIMLRTSLELKPKPKPKLCAVRTQEGAIRVCVAFAENIDVEMGITEALPSSLPPPLSEVVERFRALALLEAGCEPGWYEFFC